MLLAGIAAWSAGTPSQARGGRRRPASARRRSAAGLGATPSQRATVKYFWVVSALILVQILLGVITAHYGVEGNGFYGIPLAEVACPTA